MHWKCIGGTMDGAYYHINGQKEDFKIGDSFRIMGPQKPFKISNYIPSYEEIKKEMTIDYYVYRLARFHFSKDDTYEFLVPEGWDDKRAILHQFSK